ncbi:MAG TPA: dihydrofolate reductase family protein [Acidimicrobiales bacterium]|nr:dihydrofolate reductase family protein [Acidimicrobiales bacterium]
MLRRLDLPPSHLPEGVTGTAVDLDDLVAAEARPAPPDRPWVMLNMIASADGAIEVDGVSGPLGGPADRAAFSAVRAVADVIVAGSATVTAERYRPHRPTEHQRAARLRRGQAPAARLAVVSSRAEIDLTLPLFAEPDPDAPPYLLVGAAVPAARRVEAAAVAELVEAGDGRVDLGAALRELGARGARVVLVEGGPTLNGVLAAADLIDELCLTVSPTLVGGASSRVVTAPGPGRLDRMRLDRAVADDDGTLLLRYVRDR